MVRIMEEKLSLGIVIKEVEKEASPQDPPHSGKIPSLSTHS